jgi:hypothetical protein
MSAGLELRREQIVQHYGLLEARLSSVPELDSAFAVYETNPQHAADVYLGYVALIDYMTRLDDNAIGRIAAAQHALATSGGIVGSASKVGANDILAALGDQKAKLSEIGAQSSDPSSRFYEPAVDLLVTRLEGGHQLKLDKKTPSDFDPDSLKVIWGHTLITDPEALLHFVTCHYLERYFAESLTAQGVDLARQKDFFVNALVDVLIIDNLTTNQFRPAYDIWAKLKQQGGLEWITQDRLNSYSHSQA